MPYLRTGFHWVGAFLEKDLTCRSCGLKFGSPAADLIVDRVERHTEAQDADEQATKTTIAYSGDASFGGDAADDADADVSDGAMRGEARGAGGQ
jgi:hypothetical protein